MSCVSKDGSRTLCKSGYIAPANSRSKKLKKIDNFPLKKRGTYENQPEILENCVGGLCAFAHAYHRVGDRAEAQKYVRKHQKQPNYLEFYKKSWKKRKSPTEMKTIAQILNVWFSFWSFSL